MIVDQQMAFLDIELEYDSKHRPLAGHIVKPERGEERHTDVFHADDLYLHMILDARPEPKRL